MHDTCTCPTNNLAQTCKYFDKKCSLCFVFQTKKKKKKKNPTPSLNVPFVFFAMPAAASSFAKGSFRLTAGMPELYGISELLAKEPSCRAIAVHLLRDHPGGGVAFIESKQASGAATNWKLMAHDILRQWCSTKSQEATVEELQRVLRLQPETMGAAPLVDQLFGNLKL